LQLRQLPTDQQKDAAERAARENLSRADMRLMVAEANSPFSTEAALQETRDLIEQRAAELTGGAAGPTRGPRDPDRQHGPVVSSWSLLPSARTATVPRAKLAALEKLEWYKSNPSKEQKDLAIEAVNGGYTPAAAAELVQRAVDEAPKA